MLVTFFLPFLGEKMFLLAVAYAMKFAGIEPVMTSRHEKRTIIVGIRGVCLVQRSIQ